MRDLPAAAGHATRIGPAPVYPDVCWANNGHGADVPCGSPDIDDLGLCPDHGLQLRQWPPPAERAALLEAA